MSKIVLGSTLKALMKEKQISIRALARETGIPQSTLNQLALGREPSKIDHLLKLSKFFNVSLEYLLEGKEPRRNNVRDLKGTEVFSGLCRVRIEKINEDDGEGT